MEIYDHKTRTSDLSIYVISDVHIGNANHAKAELDATIKHISEVAKKREVIVILNGDLCECITPTDKRFSPSEVDPDLKLRDLKDIARKEANILLDKLEPLIPYIKYSVIGNHEESYIKYNHFDVYDYMCVALKCEKLGRMGMVKFVTPDSEIDFAIAHGAGGAGGKTPGWALNYCYNTFEKIDAHVNIVGHIHQQVDRPIHSMIPKDGDIGYVTRWYATTGCYLFTYKKGSGNYFEGKAGLISDIGFLEVRINGKKYKVRRHALL